MPDLIQGAEYSKDLAAIKDWLRSQPHLPNEVDDQLLRRFLVSCNFSLEKAKSTLELFFSIRSSAPEIFSRRDPFAADVRQVFKITDMIPLPNKTKENYKVFIYRLNNPNLDLFDFVDAVKTFFMLADVRLSEDPDIPDGEIPIFDSSNVSLRFLTKINLSVLKKYMLYSQEALPIRLKQVHIINTPAYIDKIHSIVKPLLKSEVSKQIYFHQPNSDSLHSFVPRSLLPEEYGGSAGKLADLKHYWIQRIEAKRPFFLNDAAWTVNESARPVSKGAKLDKLDKLRQVQGSFRSLAID